MIQIQELKICFRNSTNNTDNKVKLETHVITKADLHVPYTVTRVHRIVEVLTTVEHVYNNNSTLDFLIILNQSSVLKKYYLCII